MKQKERNLNLYGLRARLGISLAVSAAVCILVFFAMNAVIGGLVEHFYERTNLEQIQIQRQCDSLQNFIDANQISERNLEQLKKWERKQPIILLELYMDDQCIYSSIYDAPVSSLVLDENMETSNHVSISFGDQRAIAFIYSDFTYMFSVIGTIISIITAMALFILLFHHNTHRLIHYICRLNEEVQILEGGNLEYCVSVEGNDEITDLARSMNRMRETLQHQIEAEQQLQQTNRQLITEMSHDLRTPLTGIMLYLEVLRSHRYESEEQLQEYLEIIDTKAHHMKILSDHLFEYSMRDAHHKQAEPCSMQAAFGNAVSCMQDDLRTRGFIVESELDWENCFVQIRPEYIQRIFENIVSNIEKYAEPATAVRIDTIFSDQSCGLSIMNTLSKSRTNVESNGIGLESIRSMMKQMNGTCSVEQTDIIFEITLLFPRQ